MFCFALLPIDIQNIQRIPSAIFLSRNIVSSIFPVLASSREEGYVGINVIVVGEIWLDGMEGHGLTIDIQTNVVAVEMCKVKRVPFQAAAVGL